MRDKRNFCCSCRFSNCFDCECFEEAIRDFSKPGRNGIDGINGINGINGANGINGTNGATLVPNYAAQTTIATNTSGFFPTSITTTPTAGTALPAATAPGIDNITIDATTATTPVTYSVLVNGVATGQTVIVAAGQTATIQVPVNTGNVVSLQASSTAAETVVYGTSAIVTNVPLV